MYWVDLISHISYRLGIGACSIAKWESYICIIFIKLLLGPWCNITISHHMRLICIVNMKDPQTSSANLLYIYITMA